MGRMPQCDYFHRCFIADLQSEGFGRGPYGFNWDLKLVQLKEADVETAFDPRIVLDFSNRPTNPFDSAMIVRHVISPNDARTLCAELIRKLAKTDDRIAEELKDTLEVLTKCLATK